MAATVDIKRLDDRPVAKRWQATVDAGAISAATIEGEGETVQAALIDLAFELEQARDRINEGLQRVYDWLESVDNEDKRILTELDTINTNGKGQLP